MTASDPRRLIPLEGVRNFRDLGGYPTVDGYTTVWGQVYRADAISLLTETGWEALGDLGIKRVYDLRRQAERDRHETVEHGLEHEVIHMSIGPQAAEMSLVEWFAERGPDQAWGDDYVADTYRELLTEWSDVFARLMTELATPSQRPAVFHCTAGKDRTGLAAALLLSVLGVDRELILDDYELTNITRSEARIAELRPELEDAGIDVERVRPYLSAPRAAMEATLSWLEDDYGGAEGFLLASGVTPETLADLRNDLLTDDAA
ncbi:MAG: protein-tyrosine phosphatase [Actinomycetota bacterium]|jgi:protein-tyrosine phosphatase